MNTDRQFTLYFGLDVILIRKVKILLTQPNDNAIVVYIVRNLLVEAGFQIVDEFMVASAASELATNILRYAKSGTLEVGIVKNTQNIIGAELFASDSGPGISNLMDAMRDRHSTIKNSLGSGLPSVKRIMDEFWIESFPGMGTRVLARKWKHYGNG